MSRYKQYLHGRARRRTFPCQFGGCTGSRACYCAYQHHLFFLIIRALPTTEVIIATWYVLLLRWRRRLKLPFPSLQLAVIVFRTGLVEPLEPILKRIAFAASRVACWWSYPSQIVRLLSKLRCSRFLVVRGCMRCWAMSHLNAPGKLIGVHATRSVGFVTSGILLRPMLSQLSIESETSMTIAKPGSSLKNTRQ